MKKKVLMFIGSYLPGTNSAGALTSSKNMIDGLVDSVEFYIITLDRDIGDKDQYRGVKIDAWTKYENANIFYSSRYKNSIKELKRIINSINFDIYYFNGFYNILDIGRVLPLYYLKLIPKKPIIIAPRGILSMREYRDKEILRVIYRKIFKLFKFDKKVYWHASNNLEKNDILKYFNNVDENIKVIPDLTCINNDESIEPIYISKKTGKIKMVFISRISERKNIKFILELLNDLNGDIELDIYGMISTKEDEDYWNECINVISKLNDNISVKYLGEIPAKEVIQKFRQYHLFVFPTMGENYGHVVAESISSGCPVLLSDNTCWNELIKYNAGWAYSLDSKEYFIESMQYVINMDEKEWKHISNNAIKASKVLINNDKNIDKYKKLFYEVI